MENNEVSKHIHTVSIRLMALTLALLVSLILLAACGTVTDSSTQATPTEVDTLLPDTSVGDKTISVPEISARATPTTGNGFDCADVDQIPFTECAALVALYDSTNGPDWVDISGWLTTNTPCSWTGITCTDDQVSHISLSYNQLTGPLPSALGNLDNLYALYLSHNQLSGVIPVTFDRLSKLDELNLSYNQLSGPVPEFMTHIDQRMLWGNQLEGTITADGQAPFSVSYMGVNFSADPSLATSIWPEMKPASPLPEVLEGPGYWLAIPEHSRFTFADPDLPLERRRMGFNLAAEGQILVFPLAELAGMNTLVPPKIGALRNLLLERGTVQAGDLPLLPLTNAAQVFHAQEEYLDSGYVQGLRFISQYSQDPHPIMLSQELFYTFQGFTADGTYYVAAFFPLTAAVLPDKIEVEDWEAFHANYDTYLLETTGVLDHLPVTAFTPNLTLLDALVTSLRIKPGTLASGDLAYRLPIVVDQLPSVASLELNIDPAAGLITYQRDRQLWLAKADLNGDPLKLAECVAQDKVICELPSVHWSPDGSHFFYEITVNGEHRLLISDLQGQQQGFRLSHLPSRDPVWSPDGNKIILFIVDPNRPWGDHSNPELSPLEIGFIEEVWQLQMEPSGIWLAPPKVTDLETPGIGCGGGGGSTSDALYDIQGGYALGYQAARKMVWTNDDVIIYPLTCDYWQGYGRLDTQTWQPLTPYSGLLRGLTLDSSGSRWYAVTGHNRDQDPTSNRLVTGTAGSTTYEVIDTAVPVEMVFVGSQTGRLYYTARQLLDHKDLSEQIKWNKSVEPYFNFYHTQLWTILPDGTDEKLLWESDDHSFSRVTETAHGEVLFVLVENDVDLYEAMASGAPEEEWIEELPRTHIMRLPFGSNEPEIWLEDAHSLTTWYP